MKFLIAGLGSIGRRHLRNLLALGERDVLLYRTRRSTLPDNELDGLPVETDLERALDWGPDAVVVANPTALHLDVAIPAAQRGCHLFLEKPVSHSLEGLELLRQVVGQAGGQVLVGFQFRFHPALQAIQRLVQEGAIGRPLSAHAHWGEYLPGWHPWEDYRAAYSARPELGGGVILTLCHPLDYLRWIMGEVTALWAFAGKLGDLELDVEDNAEIGLRFASGASGSVHLDYNQRPPHHHLEIVGSQGSLRWENAGGTAHLYRADGTLQPFAPPPGFERNDLFLAQMRHFLAVVRGEQRPACTLQDGVRALEIALGARRSAASAQLIVW